MDHKLEHQNISTLTQFIARSQFLKKTTQLLLSVSLFSLLLSYFSYLYHSDSLNLYFRSSRYKLFIYTIDKNCMFLLCNGLLVFLAKLSGLISCSSPPSSDDYDHGGTDYMETSSRDYEHHTPMLKRGEPALLEKEILLGSTVHEEAQGKGNDEHVASVEGEVDEENIKDLVTTEDHEEETGGGEIETGLLIAEKEAEAFIEEEDDQGGVLEEEFAVDDDKFPISGEGEGNGVLSTEELNKKFDEFIRKMKEGIRIEAEQQLVMVN